MSASNWFENAILELILNNVTVPGIGDLTGLVGSTVPGNLYISLHTGDPTEAGNQGSFEATYTGYARVGVARDGTGWTVTADTGSNISEILFGEATAGTETLTHFAIGADALGPGNIVFVNALNAPLSVAPAITPRFKAGDLIVTAD